MFSTEIILAGLVLLIAAYGLVLGPQKVRTLAISAYVGIVLATQLAVPAVNWLSKQSFSWAGQISPEYAGLLLLALPAVLLELGRHHPGSRSHVRHGLVATLILSALAGLLFVASGLALLSPDHLQSILDNSNIATMIYSLRLVWVGIVPLAVIVEAFIKPIKH